MVDESIMQQSSSSIEFKHLKYKAWISFFAGLNNFLLDVSETCHFLFGTVDYHQESCTSSKYNHQFWQFYLKIFLSNQPSFGNLCCVKVRGWQVLQHTNIQYSLYWHKGCKTKRQKTNENDSFCFALNELSISSNFESKCKNIILPCTGFL